MSTFTRVSAASAAPSPQPISSLPTNSGSATRSQWTKTFSNGDSYKGEALYVHDKDQKPVKDGKGRYTWASSGAVYDGDWQGGRPHGEGVMTVPGKDGYEYSGGFVNGQRCGHGLCRLANGRTYDGEWREDEMSGRGTVRGAPGADDYEEYSGDFEVGKRSGPHGRCVYVNGDVYEGAWRDGKRQGIGEWQLHRATASSSSPPSSSLMAVVPVKYKGPFDNDSVHTSAAADGEATYSDGSSYTGEVNAQLRRHGRGVHRLANGDVFEGSFVHDQREGRGTLQGLDGMVCDGTWHRGQLDGEVRVTFSTLPGTGRSGSASSHVVDGAVLDGGTDLQRLRQLRVGPQAMASYQGPCTAGVLTGSPATITYVDGSTYRGAVRHGVPHGAGTLRDRPMPYEVRKDITATSSGLHNNNNSSGAPSTAAESARHRIHAACISPAASMTLVCYEGNFASGEPDGTGVAEWQVGTPAPTPSSASVVRATPFTLCDLLASGVVWWRTSTYAAQNGTYKGHWLRGLPHGQGVWTWADGSSYSGEVRAFLPDGHGAYASASIRYSGDFKAGQPDGRGSLEDATLGLAYDGDWAAGQPHGEGVCTLMTDSGTPRSPAPASAAITSPCVSVYDGSWERGRPSGHGRTFALPDRQRVVYDGDFVAGRREGEGTLYFGSVRRGSINSDAAALAVHAYAQYKGAFSQNHPGGGRGCLTLRNSTTVEGEFDAQLQPCADTPITVRPHNEAWAFTGTYDAATGVGNGTMTFPNGDVYKGEVEDAAVAAVSDGDGEINGGGAAISPSHAPALFNLQRHGQGTYTFVEGNKLECTWRHNILHGAGVYTAADGAKTERVYADGVLTNDAALSSVATSGGMGSVGMASVGGNVFTPENEFPNTLSEEALKSRMPEIQQQQQQQQRKRQPFSFVKRGEARQASTAGANAPAATSISGGGGVSPSPSPRKKVSTDGGKPNVGGGSSSNARASSKSTPPAQSLTPPSSLHQKSSANARRSSSPPKSSIAASAAAAGVGAAAPSPSTPSAQSSNHNNNHKAGNSGGSSGGCTTAAAANAHKYSLRRPTGSTSGNGAPPPSSNTAGAQGGDKRKRDSDAKAGTPQSNSVYLNRFQAGIRELDTNNSRHSGDGPRSPSPYADVSADTSPTAGGGRGKGSAPTTAQSGPLRRRLSSALAAGREQQQPETNAPLPYAPVTLQGSLKEMMKQACGIRNSREDEIYNLTEEMRQLNERIWQLRYVIANDGKSGAAAATSPSSPGGGRRLSNGAASGRATNKETMKSKTQRLAALVQERRVIMEKLQYIVNDPE